MYLKRYQERVVGELSHFFDTCSGKKEEMATILAAIPPEMRDKIPANWVENAFNELSLPYEDKCKNGLGAYYPRGVIKVPTGGGKTLLAVEAIREYQTRFAKKPHGLVVWIVPSETIYTQTIRQLKDKSHHLRQLIDRSSGGKTIILEKGQKLTTDDIANNLVILFVMIQSVSRANNKEALKVFQDSGGYEGFFPPDNRYDLHEKIIEQFPNVDFFDDWGHKAVKSSLGNAIRVSKPLIIIDEFHKVFTKTAKNTIDNLNPEMILGFSATPKKGMNIISRVSGLELKEEEMIKLDMHIIPPPNDNNDWKEMLRRIKEHREHLEDAAMHYQKESGRYIRPMALIQAERTGKEQRGKKEVHALDVKEYLIELGVNADQIAIKSSSQNDIEDLNLLSRDVEIRYIITKEALKEGWDNPFAYILGIIPNAQSSSSMTQLVGRILRQPYVQKTGIPELDESYVYFCKGEVSEVLKHVEAGLKSEGLEDIVGNVATDEGTPTPRPRKRVKIKPEFADKEEQFYLPVWLVKENGHHRRFSYARDIKTKLDFESIRLTDETIEKIGGSLSEQHTETDDYVVTITDTNSIAHQKRDMAMEIRENISYTYATRRLTEVIENPFLARRKAEEFIAVLIDNLGEERVAEHFGYIVSEFVAYLSDQKAAQEKAIFDTMRAEGKLLLVIIDENTRGCKIPESDEIEVGRFPNPYRHYLYEDLDLGSLNSLERRVGDIIDRQEKVLWWVRNKTGKEWYAIQGWKKNKIRPDFIVAKKKESDELEIVYILESKGEQLSGNPDTLYKKDVLDLMTELHKSGQLQVIKTTLSDLNEHAEAYIVPQNEEEEKLRKLFF